MLNMETEILSVIAVVIQNLPLSRIGLYSHEQSHLLR